jgi:beta-phosphoglucomutase
MPFGLIFDMDGVLIDSHPVHRKVWRELLLSLGREVSDEELDFILDGPRREEILHHFLGPLSPEQMKLCIAQKESLFRNNEDELQPVEGVEAFLDLVEAAAIPKVIATSASRPRAEKMLDKYGLINRFHAIVTGDDVPKGKSDPGIFVRSAEKLQVAPHEVIVFEDAVSAIRVAKTIGMKCVGVAKGARGTQLLQAGANLVVSDFRALCLSDVMSLFD